MRSNQLLPVLKVVAIVVGATSLCELRCLIDEVPMTNNITAPNIVVKMLRFLVISEPIDRVRRLAGTAVCSMSISCNRSIAICAAANRSRGFDTIICCNQVINSGLTPVTKCLNSNW
jgi:hypothetical protein